MSEAASIASLVGLLSDIIGFLLLAMGLLKGHRGSLFATEPSPRERLAIVLIIGGFIVQFLGEGLELIGNR